MRPHLFLTGEIGAGKSTAIARAAGRRMHTFGGFLTRRIVNTNGQPTAFSLMLPDGSAEKIFLDVSGERPEIFLEVFETLGIPALSGPIVILDEIGGIELLSPGFSTALEALLRSNTPILGVLKGPAPANAMIRTLGLSEEYRNRTERLWALLSQDENTYIYPCKHHDETALALAQQWVQEYCL